MKQLEAHEVPLHKVFSSDFDFHIPSYQRPYAWKAEQAEQLLADLADTLERDSDEPYFLGSIVLVARDQQAGYDVIDGQQRLTTLTILLAVLRDLTVDEELRLEIAAMIREPGRKARGLEAKPRLSLRPSDARFFRQNVQEAPLEALLALKPDALATEAQRNVQENARALVRALESWTEQRRLDLLRMLSDRTFLVVVTTADLTSAHRIFSVMNARGLDLLPSDIFKADVLRELPADEAERYSDLWEGVEEELGRSDFSDLFLHIRLIYAKQRAGRVLLKEFQEQVLSQFLPGRAAAFVDDVVLPYAEAFQQVQTLSYSAGRGAEPVNQWLRRLGQLDNNDWKPVALWALRHHGSDPDWLAEFLRRLERLSAALFIQRTYATPRANRYVQVLRQLDAGHGLDSTALSLTDEEKADVRDALSRDLYLSKTCKYVLLRLDDRLARQPGVAYQQRIVTVEHVLPQHPAQDSQWTRDFTWAQREEWTHRLANLVLLNKRKNGQARNYDFDRKKRGYFLGGGGVPTFALTGQVLQHDTWTPEVLERRQADLLRELHDEWELA